MSATQTYTCTLDRGCFNTLSLFYGRQKVGRVTFRLVTLGCTRGFVDTLSRYRQYDRHRPIQHECGRGITIRYTIADVVLEIGSSQPQYT